MQYAIELLEDKLTDLDFAYEKYVVSGILNATRPSAIENRRKAASISAALECLKIKKNETKNL